MWYVPSISFIYRYSSIYKFDVSTECIPNWNFEVRGLFFRYFLPLITMVLFSDHYPFQIHIYNKPEGAHFGLIAFYCGVIFKISCVVSIDLSEWAFARILYRWYGRWYFDQTLSIVHSFAKSGPESCGWESSEPPITARLFVWLCLDRMESESNGVGTNGTRQAFQKWRRNPKTFGLVLFFLRLFLGDGRRICDSE